MKANHFAKTLLLNALWVLLTWSAGLPNAAAGVLHLTDLKTEYHDNPIGLDVPQPRLSWKLRGDGRNLLQTAYQVVAMNAGTVVWDSGRVDSADSHHVVYAGPALQAYDRVVWRVRVWDNRGNTTQSREASFEMGPLSAQDWASARWIGRPATVPPAPIEFDAKAMRWLWYPEPGDPSVEAPAGKRAFRRNIDVARKQDLKRAFFACAADSGAKVWVNQNLVGNCAASSLVAFDIFPLLREGGNRIDVLLRNGSEAGGFIGQVVLERHHDKATRIGTDATWQSLRLPDDAEAVPAEGDWKPAREVARLGEGTFWKSVKADPLRPGHTEPPAYLRREWVLDQKPSRARLSATALGIYEIWINGQRVGDQHFAPGWTGYDKRIQFQTYDVTALLRKGRNVMAAILADGWYTGYLSWDGKRNHYGGYPLRLLASLKMFDDGGQTSLVTDGSWKASHGPIAFADFYKGEHHDARKDMPGWTTPNFDDSGWQAVQAVDEQRNLVGTAGAEVRVSQEIKPRKISNPLPGEYVFDMGQNMVGWVRLRVSGPAGTTITLRHAEMLKPDGTLYTENLRAADSVDRYTLSGRGLEVWEPRFTFHGFRYVSVSGFPGRPKLNTLTGRVAHSDIPQTLEFSTDNPLINQLQSNIDWGQRGNFLSVPTDCPQRDERLGWMGDAQVFVRTACMNRDVAAFFTKWMGDVNVAQHEGAFPDVAPTMQGPGGVGAPAWGDAGVIVPWTLYECYGDLRLLQRSFAHMAAWVDRIARENPGHLWKQGRGVDYGDWLAIDAVTDKEVLATAFFAHSAQLVAQTASVLGKTKEHARYQRLFESIASAFVQAYVDAGTGKIRGNTQTAYALALRFGLLPPDLQAKAGQQLAANVEARGHHLSTGFVGVSHLLPALSQVGRDDLAYALLTQTTFPSWLYSITQGATTIWERWDGWTKDKGFQSPAMNSFNHYSFGSVGEWMYENIAGLSPMAPGWKRIRVRPVPGAALKRASATLQTPYGPLTSRWSLKNRRFTLQVVIPANTTAQVHVPGVGGKVVANSGAVQTKAGATETVFQVGSGRWDFTSAM